MAYWDTCCMTSSMFLFCFSHSVKGSIYDIQYINIAANNNLQCKDRVA